MNKKTKRFVCFGILVAMLSVSFLTQLSPEIKNEVKNKTPASAAVAQSNNSYPVANQELYANSQYNFTQGIRNDLDGNPATSDWAPTEFQSANLQVEKEGSAYSNTSLAPLGTFNATFSFAQDADGGMAKNFTNSHAVDSNNYPFVASSWLGHQKVYRFYDADAGGYTGYKQTFSTGAQMSGYISFWYTSTAATAGNPLLLYDAAVNNVMNIYNNGGTFVLYRSVPRGGEISLVPDIADKWYYFTVYWDSSGATDKCSVWVDGVQYVNDQTATGDSATGPTFLMGYTGSATVETMSIDALDYSWTPGYYANRSAVDLGQIGQYNATDTFSSYSPFKPTAQFGNGWTDTSGAGGIARHYPLVATASTSHQDIVYLKGAGADWAAAKYTLSSSAATISVEFWEYYPSTQYWRLQVFDAGGSIANIQANGGNIVYNHHATGWTTAFAQSAAATWVHFRFAFDVAVDTVDVYVNGVLKASQLDMYSDATPAAITAAEFGGYNLNEQYFDAIDFSTDSQYYPERNTYLRLNSTQSFPAAGSYSYRFQAWANYVSYDGAWTPFTVIEPANLRLISESNRTTQWTVYPNSSLTEVWNNTYKQWAWVGNPNMTVPLNFDDTYVDNSLPDSNFNYPASNILKYTNPNTITYLSHPLPSHYKTSVLLRYDGWHSTGLTTSVDVTLYKTTYFDPGTVTWNTAPAIGSITGHASLPNAPLGAFSFYQYTDSDYTAFDAVITSGGLGSSFARQHEYTLEYDVPTYFSYMYAFVPHVYNLTSSTFIQTNTTESGEASYSATMNLKKDSIINVTLDSYGVYVPKLKFGEYSVNLQPSGTTTIHVPNDVTATSLNVSAIFDSWGYVNITDIRIFNSTSQPSYIVNPQGSQDVRVPEGNYDVLIDENAGNGTTVIWAPTGNFNATYIYNANTTTIIYNPPKYSIFGGEGNAITNYVQPIPRIVNEGSITILWVDQIWLYSSYTYFIDMRDPETARNYTTAYLDITFSDGSLHSFSATIENQSSHLNITRELTLNETGTHSFRFRAVTYFGFELCSDWILSNVIDTPNVELSSSSSQITTWLIKDSTTYDSSSGYGYSDNYTNLNPTINYTSPWFDFNQVGYITRIDTGGGSYSDSWVAGTTCEVHTEIGTITEYKAVMELPQVNKAYTDYITPVPQYVEIKITPTTWAGSDLYVDFVDYNANPTTMFNSISKKYHVGGETTFLVRYVDSDWLYFFAGFSSGTAGEDFSWESFNCQYRYIFPSFYNETSGLPTYQRAYVQGNNSEVFSFESQTFPTITTNWGDDVRINWYAGSTESTLPDMYFILYLMNGNQVEYSIRTDVDSVGTGTYYGINLWASNGYVYTILPGGTKFDHFKIVGYKPPNSYLRIDRFFIDQFLHSNIYSVGANDAIWIYLPPYKSYDNVTALTTFYSPYPYTWPNPGTSDYYFNTGMVRFYMFLTFDGASSSKDWNTYYYLHPNSTRCTALEPYISQVQILGYGDVLHLRYNPIQSIDGSITYYDQNSKLVDFSNVRTYATWTENGILKSEYLSSNRLTMDVNTQYTINVFDLFNESIYNATGFSQQFIDITLNLFPFKLQNLMRDKTNVTISKGAFSTSEWLFPNEISEHLLFNGTYHISYIQTETGISIDDIVNVNGFGYYTINTSYYSVYFSAFSNDGLGLPQDTVRLYVDGNRKDWGFVELLGSLHNVTALDYFNDTQFTANLYLMGFSEYNVFVDIATLNLYNNDTVHYFTFNITKNGLCLASRLVSPQTSLQFRFTTGTYTIDASYDNGTLYATQSITLSANDTQIVSFGAYPIHYYAISIIPVNQYGIGISWEKFVLSVNGTQHAWGAMSLPGTGILVSALDYFGNALNTTTFPLEDGGNYLLMITTYIRKVTNLMRYPSLVNWSMNGIAKSVPVMPTETESWELFPGIYNLTYTNSELNTIVSLLVNVDGPGFYQINTSYRTIYFSAYANDKLGIPDDTVRLYVDGIRRAWGPVEILGDVHDVLVLDYYGDTQNHTAFANFEGLTEYLVEISMATVSVYNNGTFDALTFKVYKHGIPYQDVYVGRAGMFTYRATPGDYYIYAYYNNGTLAGEGNASITTIGLTKLEFGFYAQTVIPDPNSEKASDAIVIAALCLLVGISFAYLTRPRSPIDQEMIKKRKISNKIKIEILPGADPNNIAVAHQRYLRGESRAKDAESLQHRGKKTT